MDCMSMDEELDVHFILLKKQWEKRDKNTENMFGISILHFLIFVVPEFL